MFRIRRVHDDVLQVNREAIGAVQVMLREQFVDLRSQEIEGLPQRLRNPMAERFRPLLWVAEGARHRVRGFALLLHEPELEFGWLDYIAAGAGGTGGGVGSALYEVVRDEAAALGCRAVLFECLPDSPEAGLPKDKLRENRARLRFYERYGARPVVDTEYERPVDPDDEEVGPYLVIDPLGGPPPPPRWLRPVVRAVLERKYAWLCPPEYIDRVVASFRGEELALRPPRYSQSVESPAPLPRRRDPIPIVVNDRHEIHHVRDRGYVEAPVRVKRILDALEPTGSFRPVEPREWGLRHLESVHDPELVHYLERASREVEEGKSLYPYVFPIRNRERRPRDRSVLAGYYCIDTFTPIHRNSFLAARRAVDCALTCARELLEGERLAYALVRPPGHHAERGSFGGFCYFNSTAVAAHYLSSHGRVAILDVDYHHGNGQQDIFYRRCDVLTVSIHGHPRFAYPYFAGFEEEEGEGAGAGFNLNLPQPESLDGRGYRRALRKALERIESFDPVFLVVALGLDPAAGDPTGTWSLRCPDFARNGQLIGSLGLPTVVVQEGGYRTRTLGTNARAFFEGLLDGAP